MISPHRHFHRLAWAASLLALVVIVFGGFVRLSHAGLSCPDWPTCYGKATWPVHGHEVDSANQAYPQRAVEVHKAWREQFHRHLAATLGLMVLGLALLAARHRPWGRSTVLLAVALIAPAIPLYMAGYHTWSAVLTIAGELLLLIQALRWSNQDFARVSLLLLMVIVFQATLGLWTVSWLLKPVVVMGHLLGGLLTFSLLVWIAWRSTPGRSTLVTGHASKLKRLVMVGVVLLTIQIALGGWTSSNYASLACGSDFPTCSGQWWPDTDFKQGFVIWRGIGVNYEGGVLDGPARTAIHLSHRLFALLVFGHLLFLALRLRRSVGVGAWGWGLGLALGAQMALGISNVIYGLPLIVATAHLAGAALLLFVLITLLARLRPPREA